MIMGGVCVCVEASWLAWPQPQVLWAGAAVEFVQNGCVDFLEDPLLCFRLRVALVHENPLITRATVHATVAHHVVQRLILEQKEDGIEKEREIKINKQETQSPGLCWRSNPVLSPTSLQSDYRGGAEEPNTESANQINWLNFMAWVWRWNVRIWWMRGVRGRMRERMMERFNITLLSKSRRQQRNFPLESIIHSTQGMYIFALETTEYAKQSWWKNRGCVPEGVIRLSRGGTCLRAFGSSSVPLSPGLIYCSLRLRQLHSQVPPLLFNCIFPLSIAPSLTYPAMTVIFFAWHLKALMWERISQFRVVLPC